MRNRAEASQQYVCYRRNDALEKVRELMKDGFKATIHSEGVRLIVRWSKRS